MFAQLGAGLARSAATRVQLVRQLYQSGQHSAGLLQAQRPQPAVVQARHSSGAAHDHSGLWKLEKVVSGGLLAVIPAAFLVPMPALDYALAFSLVLHVHWGLEAIAVDYVRPSLFGTLLPKLALAYVYALSALALAGLFYFNYTDVGLAKAIKMFLQK